MTVAAPARTLTLRRPDDWHLHLRDGAMLEAVVGSSARHFGRALIMPNLDPPVVTADDALAYRGRVLAARDAAASAAEEQPVVDGAEASAGVGEKAARVAAMRAFTPLMTLYLTEATDPADVVRAALEGIALAVKLYPAGATTNSASGVTDLARVGGVLEAMAEHRIPLCVHGEVTDADVDIFDREARFIETVLLPLRERLPELRITLEHVTTAEGIEVIRSAGANLAGSITPHHLLINRNHLLVGGVRPHYYCLPILKRERHRLALLEAATSGDARFFLGTDSAPHPRGAKESACGCAGVFNAANALVCLAEVFEEHGALDRLETFVSLNGPAWYALAPSADTLTLERHDRPVPVPSPFSVGDDSVVPFDPGRPIHWQVREVAASC